MVDRGNDERCTFTPMAIYSRIESNPQKNCLEHLIEIRDLAINRLRSLTLSFKEDLIWLERLLNRTIFQTIYLVESDTPNMVQGKHKS